MGLFIFDTDMPGFVLSNYMFSCFNFHVVVAATILRKNDDRFVLTSICFLGGSYFIFFICVIFHIPVSNNITISNNVRTV